MHCFVYILKSADRSHETANFVAEVTFRLKNQTNVLLRRWIICIKWYVKIYGGIKAIISYVNISKIDIQKKKNL